MGRSGDERVTSDVAREICQREGVKAMILGSISSLGSHYVVALEAVNAQNGDSLAREQVEAESKEQVLKSLDRAASQLRGKLGESIGSVQKFDTPLEAATTSSLDALKEFSLGEAEHQKFNDEAAIPHLKRAVELDPNFAMALATLGVAYNNTGNSKDASEYIQKAFDAKERASEREKFYISSHYYGTFRRQADKDVETLEQWIQAYPRDNVPQDNLALAEAGIGQREKALASATEALRLDPKDPYAYQNVASAYLSLNRYDEAKAVAEQAIAQKTEPWSSTWCSTESPLPGATKPPCSRKWKPQRKSIGTEHPSAARKGRMRSGRNHQGERKLCAWAQLLRRLAEIRSGRRQI